MKRFAVTLSIAIAAGALIATPADARPSLACKGDEVKAHELATRREATLDGLVARSQPRRDPFGWNGPQISALQNARSSIVTLDQHVQSTCYATLREFRADASKFLTDYRVYWLRVPQTRAIEAADRLKELHDRLDADATKLGKVAPGNADVAAMSDALRRSGDELQLISGVTQLQPAADMTADQAALESAHTALLAARAALAEARADGLKVVATLKH